MHLNFFVFQVRDNTSTYEQRKNPSKIIASLTPHSPDEQQVPSSAQKLQTQLSVQDTIQRHFCQILKNDSLTVTDNTSITETLLMRENSSSGMAPASASSMYCIRIPNCNLNQA